MRDFLQIAVLVGALFGAVLAQDPARKNQRPAAEPTPTPAASSQKRNGRPADGSPTAAAAKTGFVPVYIYEFTRPGFTYERILILHDDDGVGTITFKKGNSDESFTDPISLSAGTMMRLRQDLDSLNFTESTENYQYIKDYSNLGNSRITVKKNGKERSVVYNWTDNKIARDLSDLYRSIGNEYTWQFEMKIALENQPLQTPSLMDALDAYLERGEIADPIHLSSVLSQLSNDERMPLIARDHASKLLRSVSKPKRSSFK